MSTTMCSCASDYGIKKMAAIATETMQKFQNAQNWMKLYKIVNHQT